MKSPLILMLLLSLVFSSCFIIDRKTVRGNGDRAKDERQVGEFDGVTASGDFDVYIRNGTGYSVTLEGDANLLEYIDTDKKGGNLRIRVRDRHNLDYRQPMKAWVTAPSVKDLTVAGSGNIVADDELSGDREMHVEVLGSGNIDIKVRTPKISATVAGSGDISLSGEAERFESSIAGSGNIRAGNLKTSESSVQIAGSGNARVNASSQLNIEIMGSGGVEYAGTPKINQKIMGSGSVSSFQ